MAVVGWDIGGAHLKAARCEEGRIVATAQIAAPLRLGLERLVQAFAEAKALIGSANSHETIFRHDASRDLLAILTGKLWQCRQMR